MLRLKREQRAILAEKIPDIANIAAGALIFGQAMDGGQFSRSLALVGFVVWVLLFGFAMMFAGGATGMTGFVILMGGITLVVGLVALADFWARRHDEKARLKTPQR